MVLKLAYVIEEISRTTIECATERKFCHFMLTLTSASGTYVDISGGSRIFPRGGANSQKCYYFSIFCRKLHENERIWTPRGGRASLAPPLGSANGYCRTRTAPREFGPIREQWRPWSRDSMSVAC